jgi:archaellum component FlaC
MAKKRAARDINAGGVSEMDLSTYCGNLSKELTDWKAKIEVIVKELDRIPSGDKEKVVPEVNELHALVEGIEDRIERLKKDCPEEWSPDRIELDNKLTQITNIYEEVWENVSGADVGG